MDQQTEQRGVTLPKMPPKPDPSLPSHDPIGEEMVAVGLNPNEVSNETYLKARALAASGKLKTIGDLRETAIALGG